jgi:hypothetical protein
MEAGKMSMMAGVAVCAVQVAGDYGSTVLLKRRVERQGLEIREVGPVASHGLELGAGVRGGLCLLGEVILREKPRQRRIFRVVGTVLVAGIVTWHMHLAPR